MKREFAASAAQPGDPFWEALCDPDKRPFAVELDSPETADLSRFLAGARELWDRGALAVTIADCPVARIRVDSCLMACKLRREYGINALPHMTCRDRNLNATQALMLGLCAEGIRDILIITGDPVPAARREEVKSVYNFNSRTLMSYVRSLNESVLPVPFRIFGGLNVNARNFRVELDRALRKEENGAVGFFTQPVLTPEAYENLKLARQALDARILGGIMPVVSQRNAVFMNENISGIRVDEALIARYEGLDRQQGEALAVEVSARIAGELAPWVDGYYIMTPFGRTALVGRIMERIQGET